MNGIKKTFLINLDKDKNRLKNVSNELQKQKVNFTRIAGINGKELSNCELKKNTTLFCKLFCTRGTIGCAMSHKKVLNEIVNSKDLDDKDKILILEDDVKLHDNFRNLLQKVLKSTPKDCDVLYIGYFLSNYNNEYNNFIKLCHMLLGCHFKSQKQVNEYIYEPKCPMATHGYIVTKKGARKLLENINNTKIYYHIDAMMKNYYLNPDSNIKVYASNPILVRQDRISSKSNIIDSEYPHLIYNYFNKYKTEWDLSYGDILFSPSFQILGIPVHAVNIIFFILFTSIVI